MNQYENQHTLIDHVTIYADERIVFSFMDGNTLGKLRLFFGGFGCLNDSLQLNDRIADFPHERLRSLHQQGS